jgi:uncharacterized protein DUF6804
MREDDIVGGMAKELNLQAIMATDGTISIDIGGIRHTFKDYADTMGCLVHLYSARRQQAAEQGQVWPPPSPSPKRRDRSLLLLQIASAGIWFGIFLSTANQPPYRPYERNEFLQLGRLLVFAISAYTAYSAAMSNKRGWAWLFGLLAVTYNPFIEARLDRAAWQLLDLAAAMVSVVSLFGLKVYVENAPVEASET